MQIRAPIALQAVLKSLTEVVLPAIAGDNKLAQEQAHLIVGLLRLIAERLPLEFHYDIDELTRLNALGRKLQDLTPDEALAADIRRGEGVLARAGAAPAELIDAIGILRAAIGECVQRLATVDDATGRVAARAVLDAAREQQLRERSWLLMQGWEIDPRSVPPIESLIATRASESAR
jgi:hypothetical protein